MPLADYLAKNYLTADSPKLTEKKSKKRKRKAGTSTSKPGLTIAEDDITGWEKNNDSGDEDAPTTANNSTADFRKAKSSWQTVGMPPPSHSDQAAADAIILSAAADTKARYAADEDEPPPTTTSTINKMESGAHAGLQTAAQVAAQLSQSRAAEHARFLTDSTAHLGQNAETIYRDASGRIINVAMKRAEARQATAAAAAKEKAEAEAAKGDIQRAEASFNKKKLADAKFIPLARYEDDVEMNDELRDQQRWNDPAAGFLEENKSKKKNAAGAGKKSVSGKPLYAGSGPPNRYGIRPGYRWDGVDRGNGFEKKYFAAMNKRKNLKELSYAWQMDE